VYGHSHYATTLTENAQASQNHGRSIHPTPLWGLENLLYTEDPISQIIKHSSCAVSTPRDYVHITPEQHYKKTKYFKIEH